MNRSALAAGTNAPTLGDLQAALTKAIFDGDDGILPYLCDNSRTDRATLLGVYRHGYMARLTEIIGDQYPTLAHYLGADAFDEMARAYVRLHPSSSPNARWVGRDLPSYLTKEQPYQALPVLGELAQIEQAMADAFDSSDAALVSMAELAAVHVEQWGRLCFASHPSVRRLDLTTNARQIWQSLNGDLPPTDAAVCATPDHLLIWRAEFQVQVRVLVNDEAQMWDCAAAGQTFGDICALAARFGDADKAALMAATYLQGWVTRGQLSVAWLR